MSTAATTTVPPGITLRPIRAEEFEAARALLQAGGWDRRVGDPVTFARLVERSSIARVAVDTATGEVVGFLRALTDGLSNGYLSMLVVAEAHRRRGIGRALVLDTLGDDPAMTWVLRAGRPGVQSFYERLGFVRSEAAMERRRAEPPAPATPAAAPGTTDPRHWLSSGSTFETQIGYSRAVVDGDWIFVSGTTGFDYATMTIADDIAAQTAQCFATLARVLAEAGASLDDIVRIRYIVPQASEFEQCWPVLKRHLAVARPAATMLSAGLLDPRMKIEIEVTARRHGTPSAR